MKTLKKTMLFIGIMTVFFGYAAKQAAAQPSVTVDAIGINITNDFEGRIYDAFSKAVSELGIRIGGDNPRYVLNVNVALTPQELPGSMKFTQINVRAGLTDTGDETVLLPYNFNIRQGHVTLKEAENRAYNEAVRRINSEYKALLEQYLSRLKPPEEE